MVSVCRINQDSWGPKWDSENARSVAHKPDHQAFASLAGFVVYTSCIWSQGRPRVVPLAGFVVYTSCVVHKLDYQAFASEQGEV